MTATQVSRHIDAPPERVWEVVTDLDRTAEVIAAIDDVERLDGGDEFGVGTRWRETRTVFGRSATEEMQVVDLQPGRSYTTTAERGRATYASTVSVTGADGGCRATMSFEGRPNGLLARLVAATLGRLVIGATRKALRRDLDDIAAAATRAEAG